jgi:hypothetical protein
MEFPFGLDQKSNVRSRDMDKIEGHKMLFANSTEITQCNHKAQDHQRGRTVLSIGLSGFCGLYRTTHAKVKEQVKTKAILLFW